MGGLVEQEGTVVEAPAHVTPPTRHEQAKAARGAKLWTWIARITGLALLAAVLGFGFYLATANAAAREDRSTLITQFDEERAKVDALYELLRSVGEPVVGPQGPQGPAGADGLNGMNGVSVTGVSCVLRDDLSTAFRFTFSDVSFVDVPGPCLP